MSGGGSEGMSEGQRWAAMQAQAEMSDRALCGRGRRKVSAGEEETVGMISGAQTKGHVGVNETPGLEGSTTRTRSALIKVAESKAPPKPARKTRQRKVLSSTATAKGWAAADKSTSKPDIATLAGDMVDSRPPSSASDMSDPPEDILIQSPPAGVEVSIPSPRQDYENVATALGPQRSVSDATILTEDVDMMQTRQGVTAPYSQVVENGTSAARADENVVSETQDSVGLEKEFIPSNAAVHPPQTLATLPSFEADKARDSVESEALVVAPRWQRKKVVSSVQVSSKECMPKRGSQKRRRVKPVRIGATENSASDALPESTPTSDTALEDEDKDEYEESPRKKRRTSSAATNSPYTPVKKGRPSNKTEPATGATARQNRAATGSKGSADVTRSNQSNIVVLQTSPKALKALFQTPPRSAAKTPQKTPPKQPRKQATRAPLETPQQKPRGRPRKSAPKTTQNTPTASVLPLTPDSIAAEPFQPDISVDPVKLALSQKLTARGPLGAKPKAQGEPLVWAESRQALCETLPYFKRPQGGCYQNDSHVYGFLFDSVGHCREYLDEDIIICRAGGSMEQDPIGGMVQKKDQLMKEAQVQAILNDIAHQNPLIVICGNRNGGAKCEMPHQYSVLGWYKPVAVWEEKTAGRGKKIWTTIKYRLERLNQAAEPVPWHASAESDLSVLRCSSASSVYRQECTSCGKDFDQVYLQGWMCLNSACDDFWRIDGSSAPSGNAGLDYNPDYLLQRAPAWGDESIPPAPVRPPIPDVGNIIGDDLAYINTRGICCPKCGRCNSRRLFDRWVCENPTCDYELRPEHRPVMPLHLHTPWDVAPTLVRNKVEAGVHLKIEHKYGYKVCTYTFDGIDGCFIHAAATKAILGAPNGPDEMMADLQSQDLGLERRVFAVTKMSGGKKVEECKSIGPLPGPLPSPPRGEQVPDPQPSNEEQVPAAKDKRTFDEGDLMTAFSMNYGMPYKFVASGASRSFEDSPKAVNDCRYRLNWAARALLGKSKDVLDFNEELIFTYLEGQKIEYHDDGEDGLGPEIASLSLGGRAKMHMRMKAKHHVGCSKTGILTEEKPVPGSMDGSAMYEKRLAAWIELQKLKSDSVAYNKRRKELPKELGIFDKRTKKADDLVTVTLSHGDIMVMDGYDIQRYLEHKVVSEGYLRFALTCRTVLEDHLKPKERPDYVVQPDEGTYDGSVGF